MSFDHVAWRPLPYSMGVPIGSDWQDKPAGDPVFDLYRTCGFWTESETELLREVAVQFATKSGRYTSGWDVGGSWLEIGAHSGWCTEKLSYYAKFIVSIEPMFSLADWYERFADNVGGVDDRDDPRGLPSSVMPWAGRSDQYFACWDGGGGRTFDGCLIDGDHCAPHPLNDAKGCFDRLNERGVILLHDFRGPDVWDAAKYLVDRGMQWKVYPSVHMVFVAWRGEFTPPPVFQEGAVDWAKHYGLPEWAR